MNVFALGVCRKEEIFYAKAAGVGNPVIYVGANTGRDGIHGASMASAEFTEESKQKRPNVQVGDPFMEKLLLEACLEAMQTGAIVGIQDMGAAGLTCSTCEMGSRGEVGIEIELDRVPQRETGMTPYEIMLSESQERMLLVADKGREEEVFAGVPQVGPGRRRDRRGDRRWQAARAASRRGGRRDSQSRAGRRSAALRPAAHRAAARAPHDARSIRRADLQRALPALLAAPDICSKRWIWEQYDYKVRTNTVAGPGAPTPPSCASRRPARRSPCRSTATAATAISRRAKARKLAVAECCRNLSTVGALPVAATNNLNFGNPERPEIMAQLVEAIEGIAEACRFFETPITGGNVSLYNETLGEGIYPTPVLGIVGLLKTAAPVHDSVQERRPQRDAAGRHRRLRRHPLRRHAVRQGDRWSSSGACRRRSIWSTKSACRTPSARSSPRAWRNRRTI